VSVGQPSFPSRLREGLGEGVSRRASDRGDYNASLKSHRHPGLVPGSTVPQGVALAAPWMPAQGRHDGL